MQECNMYSEADLTCQLSLTHNELKKFEKKNTVC